MNFLKNKFFLILIIILILSIPLFLLNSKEIELDKSFEMNYAVYIDNFTGIRKDTDVLHYGVIPFDTGGLVWRKFNITNSYNESYQISALIDGPMKDNLYFSNNSFILNSKESLELQVTLSIDPNEFDKGLYEGSIKFVHSQIKNE